MKLWPWLLILSLLGSCTHHPSRSIAQADQQIQQVLALHDQAEDPMPMGGKYQGQTAENTAGRTVSLLTPEEKRLFGIEESQLALANFRHMGQFYIVAIQGMTVNADQSIKSSDNVVEQVAFRKEYWSPMHPATTELETHSFLKFTFKNQTGIRLVYNQSDAQLVPDSTPLIQEAVISFEAVKSATNPDPNFMPDSLRFDLASGYLFYSWQERVRITAGDIRVNKTLELDFSRSASLVSGIESPKDALFFTGLLSSHRDGRKQTYNILFNNCAGRAFDLIDQSVRPTAAMNFEPLQKAIVEFTGGEAKIAANVLLEMARARGVTLPQEVEHYLVQLSTGVIVKQVSDLQIESRANPRTFLYELPPFVEAHLRARGLLP